MKRTRVFVAAPLLGVLAVLAGCHGSPASAPPPSSLSSAASSAPSEPAAARASSEASPDVALQRRLDATIDAAVSQERIVGTVVVVARDGKIVYHRAAGLADREAGRPVREDTVFRLASMTKLFVSSAALALVDSGALRLDDPVTKYLPTFRPKLANGKAPTITIRHLLTHTSGLDYGFAENENGPFHRARVSNGLDQPGLSFEENLTRLGQAPLLAEPGTAWNYSMSTDVLGGVVAKAGGAPLPDVVRRLVTEPLGLAHTGFTAPDAGHLATAYADGRPRPTRMKDGDTVSFFGNAVTFAPSRTFDTHAYPSGGGGMVGTAEEYVRLLEMIRTGGGKVLSAESIAGLTNNQVGNLKVPQGGGTWGWTLGLAVLEKPDATMASNPGTLQWGGVYGNSYFVDPKAKLTVVTLTNTAVAGMMGEFPDAVRTAVYGR